MDIEYASQLLSPLIVPIVVAIGATIVVARSRRTQRPEGWALEVWIRWWFYGAMAGGAIIVGLSFLVAPRFMAASLGFDLADDFQREVAFSNLGFALSAILAVRLGSNARLAVVAGYMLFLYGATFGHLFQQFARGDTAAGNTGGILVYDVVIPAVALGLVLRERRRAPAVA